MKTKLHFTIAAFALAVFGHNVAAQETFTYNFNTDLAGVVTASNGGIPERGIPGTNPTPLLNDNGVPNSTGVLIQRQAGLIVNNTNVNDLTSIPSATDYSITWKEYVRQLPDATTTSHRRGFLLRGRATSSYAGGLKRGYIALIQGSSNGSVVFRILDAASSGISQIGISSAFFIGGGTTGLSINNATWYRVSVTGTNPVVITFATSTDGVTFTNRFTHNDTTNLYPDTGVTQTVSGIGFASYDWQILDDITFNTITTAGTEDFNLNSFSVFKTDNGININSADVTIKSVQLFDISGRVIASKNNVNASETSFSNLSIANGLVLVQITDSNDRTVTRKLLY